MRLRAVSNSEPRVSDEPVFIGHRRSYGKLQTRMIRVPGVELVSLPVIPFLLHGQEDEVIHLLVTRLKSVAPDCRRGLHPAKHEEVPEKGEIWSSCRDCCKAVATLWQAHEFASRQLVTCALAKPFGSFVSQLYAKSSDLDVSVELCNALNLPIIMESFAKESGIIALLL
uniref:Polymerase nucleotidyl transferase domain-containing protein n=1 Tax=Oryza brachyantha TaxID=4533 RepID=J3LIX5_ORYBR